MSNKRLIKCVSMDGTLDQGSFMIHGFLRVKHLSISSLLLTLKYKPQQLALSLIGIVCDTIAYMAPAGGGRYKY